MRLLTCDTAAAISCGVIAAFLLGTVVSWISS